MARDNGGEALLFGVNYSDKLGFDVPLGIIDACDRYYDYA